MTISIIVAMDKNRVIGNKNQLPWYLPADLKHFKTITMGKPIIMGRKTYESIGKPLPGRRNIVISRQKELTLSGCDVFHSLDDALKVVKNDKEVMIIGGAEIFEKAFPKINYLYLTLIDHEFEGDTYFPEWSESEWEIISRENHSADEKNPYSYSFLELSRIS